MSRARALRRPADALGDRLNRMPIRLKLAGTFAGVMIVLFGVMFLILYWQYADGLDNGIKTSLVTRAADLAVIAEESDARLRANRVLPEGSGGFAQIVDPNGHVLATTAGVGGRPLLTASELAGTAHGPVSVDVGERSALRAYRVPVTGSSPADAAGANANVLIVGVSLADRNGALNRLQTLMFFGGPIALLLACIAGYAVAAKALAPVESMRRRASAIVGGEPGERLPVSEAHDEIQRLGETLNEMLARVEDVVGRGRAFVAGASHELRTPLTILQLELDDALGGERSTEELEHAISSAREEVRRLTSLTEDLLVIAQTDQKRLPINHERIEAHEAMRVIADRYAQLNELVGKPVIVEQGQEVYFDADVARLDQALSNLVHNSLRFGEGPVLLRARKVPGNVELHVLDSGPGFPTAFLPHAFERFSRADPARSQRGTGLGLAIVLAIAEAHGGRVDASNRPRGGAHVWLTLPVSARAARNEGSSIIGSV
jgi:two-component system, OmpR family, sensor kinase